MKKSGIITLGLASMLMMFTACQQDSDEIGSDIDALELESDAALETTYEEVDQVVEIGFESLESGMRTEQDELGECVNITHDEENKTVTIDFGDGCVGRHGNTFAGKIVIEYNQRLYQPGAFRQITFVNFFFNEIGVEGTRRLENTTATDTERQFTVTLTGGKLDFGDGNFVTRDASWVRTWYVGEGEVKLSGSASGININGFDYSTTVSPNTPLLFLRACPFRVPVSGIKTLVVGDRQATIDYGDGTCDRKITVTVNGETREITLRPRRGQDAA